MSLRIQDIPSVDTAPDAAAGPSPYAAHLRRLQARSLSRRSMLRLGLAAGMAAGMSAVSWLPPARPRHAAAAVGPKGETEFFDCAGYQYDGVTCIGGRVSSSYCNSAKWHRTDYGNGSCYTWGYDIAWNRCAKTQEAWRWQHNGAWYRCADGIYHYQACGSGPTSYYTICSARL